jgi:hypothetical protein
MTLEVVDLNVDNNIEQANNIEQQKSSENEQQRASSEKEKEQQTDDIASPKDKQQPKTKKKAGRPVGLKMPQTKYVEVDRSKDVIQKIEELTKQINDLKLKNNKVKLSTIASEKEKELESESNTEEKVVKKKINKNKTISPIKNDDDDYLHQPERKRASSYEKEQPRKSYLELANTKKLFKKEYYGNLFNSAHKI